MSTKTVKICDIDNCGQLAMYTWKDFLYRVQKEVRRLSMATDDSQNGKNNGGAVKNAKN